MNAAVDPEDVAAGGADGQDCRGVGLVDVRSGVQEVGHVGGLEVQEIEGG